MQQPQTTNHRQTDNIKCNNHKQQNIGKQTLILLMQVTEKHRQTDINIVNAIVTNNK